MLAVAAALIGQTGAAVSRPGPPALIRINVAGNSSGPAIPAGFIGFSIEYPSAPVYFGSSPIGLNPIFIKLVRDVAPTGSPVIRFGGDTTDWTWAPAHGITKPPGVHYALTSRWLETTRAIAVALSARLVFGINLEADSATIAAAEARAVRARVGRSLIAGFELGNEPEVYGTLGWYRSRAGVGGARSRARL
jgi:hypothetical protein